MTPLELRLVRVADHVANGLTIDDDANLLREAADRLVTLRIAVQIHRASHTGMPTNNDKALWAVLEGN
jgi:hypothetical protein